MFFEYRQNNSGGSFVINDTLTVVVVIEAPTSDMADARAQELGIYFDGCNTGDDCPCCGDRWYPAYDGTEDPYAGYTVSPDGKVVTWTNWSKDKPFMRIFYLDGRVESLLATEAK